MKGNVEIITLMQNVIRLQIIRIDSLIKVNDVKYHLTTMEMNT